MTIVERELMARRLGNDVRREFSAYEYYSVMAGVTQTIESSNAFMLLADVRRRRMNLARRRYTELQAG